MQETLMSIWGLFLSAFISSTVAPGGSEAVLAYMVSQGHFQTQNLVIVATLGNTLGAMTTWGLGMFTAKKISNSQPFVRKETKCTKYRKKKRYLGIVFFMVTYSWRCAMFCGWMVKAPISASMLNYFARKTGSICCNSMGINMR